jgi:uncharacterized protein YqgC (DUF456 family)
VALGVFGSLTLASFALSVLGSGLFTAYFGAGKSRRIGFGLTVVGLLAALAFVIVTFELFPEVLTSPWGLNDILLGLAGVAGALVGGLVGTLVFLGAIVRA